jgi:hypothetical protein
MFGRGCGCPQGARGLAAPHKALLAQFAAAGADRCLLALAHPDASETLAAVDQWAGLIPG